LPQEEEKISGRLSDSGSANHLDSLNVKLTYLTRLVFFLIILQVAMQGALLYMLYAGLSVDAYVLNYNPIKVEVTDEVRIDDYPPVKIEIDNTPVPVEIER